MKRNRRNRYKILAKALTTRVRNLTRECEDLRLKLEQRPDLKEIRELRAALSRACAQLMGPLAPGHKPPPVADWSGSELDSKGDPIPIGSGDIGRNY